MDSISFHSDGLSTFKIKDNNNYSDSLLNDNLNDIHYGSDSHNDHDSLQNKK